MIIESVPSPPKLLPETSPKLGLLCGDAFAKEAEAGVRMLQHNEWGWAGQGGRGHAANKPGTLFATPVPVSSRCIYLAAVFLSK